MPSEERDDFERVETTDHPETAAPRVSVAVWRIEAWFNAAAFTNPVAGTDGTVSRGIIDGPGYRSVDLGLFRDFGLPRGAVLQFRMEATNVLNIVNLQNPGTVLNAAATFGKIRSAREMRRVQLGARFSF